MLRKKAVIIMALVIAFTAIGVNGNTVTAAEPVTKTVTKSAAKKGSKGKILIAYFSRAGENYSVGNIKKGNTKIVAEMIAKQTGGKLFEIKTRKSYPKDYDECKAVVEKEANENARPKLKNEVKNMAQYDTIYLGYPIWYGDMPMAVYTFLESYNWEGKTVIPFCTHEGSGLSGTPATIKKTVGKKAAVEKGLAIQGSVAQNSRTTTKKKVKAWLKKVSK